MNKVESEESRGPAEYTPLHAQPPEASTVLSPASTVTRQTVLVAKEPASDAEIAVSRNFSAMVLQAVRDEDYRIGFDIQSAMHSGANREFIFGRNEPAVQNYHRWVARFMGQEADIDWG